MEIKNWKIDPNLKKEIDEHYRTRFALSIKNETVDSIVKKITFDSVAPNITTADVANFFEYVHTKYIKPHNGKGIHGVGLEVGGGSGFFSALLANYPAVEKVYSVEVCENIVRELMPKVIGEISPNKKDADKVVGCVGDFDNLEVSDASVDFIFDFYSLHHSSDIGKTFKELYRVLKPGGFVFCFDKARANNMTDADLEKLLDTEYSSETKMLMGLPKDVFHTRRMNGEKEYRLKDWKQAFLGAGFKVFEHYHVARLNNTSSGSGKIKLAISKLPPRIQAFVSGMISRGGNSNNLEQSHKVYSRTVNNFPKEISLMVVWK